MGMDVVRVVLPDPLYLDLHGLGSSSEWSQPLGSSPLEVVSPLPVSGVIPQYPVWYLSCITMPWIKFPVVTIQHCLFPQLDTEGYRLPWNWVLSQGELAGETLV